MTDTRDREALLWIVAWADDNAYRGDTAAIQHRWMTVAALAREKLARLDAPDPFPLVTQMERELDSLYPTTHLNPPEPAAPVLTEQAVREALELDGGALLSCVNTIDPGGLVFRVDHEVIIRILRDLGAFGVTEPRQAGSGLGQPARKAGIHPDASEVNGLSAGAPDVGTDEHPAIKDIRMLRDAALSHGMPATLNMHTENAVLRVRDLIAKRDAPATPALPEDVREELIERLTEIEEGRGPFSRDHLTHASNVIEHSQAHAKRIKELLGLAQQGSDISAPDDGRG